MDGNINYLKEYQAINAKLKKRFLKKPNLAEGSADFNKLANKLENDEQAFHYAALFAKAHSRCEGALGNFVGEAGGLLRSAHLYLKAEDELERTLSISLHENLELAISCFVQAAHVYEVNGQPLLAVSAYLQLADALMRHSKYAEASVHLHKASDLVPTHTLLMLLLLSKLGTCKVLLNDLHTALKIFTRMQEILHRSGGGSDSQLLQCYEQHMRACEVSRVLLLCLLGKKPDKAEPEHADTLERYMWASTDEESPPPYLPDSLFLGLQSLVCASEAGDAGSVEEIHEQLFEQLSDEQNFLMYALVEQLRSPPVSGVDLGQPLSEASQADLLGSARPF